jgi:hypothetical protein
MGLMPRAVRESATANGMTPPAAIKPIGDEISKTSFVMVRPDGKSIFRQSGIRFENAPL